MSTTTQRLHGLDFLRALMMSLGVVLHTAQVYLTMPLVDYYWDSARSPSMDGLLIFINTFRMPVFYLLSGFFTALLLHRRGLSAMLENRYQRIVVPFLIFLPVLAITMSLLRIVASHVMQTGQFGFDWRLVEHPELLWNNTHNLWFLYYLILHVLTAWAFLRLRAHTSSSVANLEAGPVTEKPKTFFKAFIVVCLGLSAIGSLSDSGRISANLSFLPDLSVYAYFGLCFLLGWVLYQQMQELENLARRWRRYMIIATVLFVAALWVYVSKDEPGSNRHLMQHAALSLGTGFSIGFYMLGFVGMFSRYFQNYSPWIRYFSDSAYWIFVFHSIPLISLALMLHAWDVAAELKFLVVCTGTLLMCLWTYQAFVRNGRIGELLNGRRHQSAPWKSR